MDLRFFGRSDDFSPALGRRSVFVVCLATGRNPKKTTGRTIRVCGEAALCYKGPMRFRRTTWHAAAVVAAFVSWAVAQDPPAAPAQFDKSELMIPMRDGVK